MEAIEILKKALRKYNITMRKNFNHDIFNPNHTIEEYEHEIQKYECKKEKLKEVLEDITNSINENIQGMQRNHTKLEKMKK